MHHDADPGRPMIKLEHVYKTYPAQAGQVPALIDVNLHVKRGEIFGVIGQSGAGKSTLIRCVNLLERPDTGKVIVDNQLLSALSARDLSKARHQMGMIFQHFNLLSSRNVFDNIALPLELLHYPRKKIQETIAPLLALTDLSQKTDAYPHQLSGGQKQRVAIARALASQPAVLLCDEATSALDLHTTQSILELLKDINKKLGITILMITHEMEVVKAICDRVALLSAGHIIECAPMSVFFTQPKTEKAKALVATMSHRALPEKLIKIMRAHASRDSAPIWRIYFTGSSAQHPLMTSLIQRHNLEINIFQAHIETLKEDTLGIMDVTVQGTPENIQQGMQFLMTQGARVEVMGYV